MDFVIVVIQLFVPASLNCSANGYRETGRFSKYLVFGVYFEDDPRRQSAAKLQQSRRRYAANGFAFVPLNPTVPPIPHTAPGRVVELAVREPPARRGKHSASALVCSGKKVGIRRRPTMFRIYKLMPASTQNLYDQTRDIC